MPLLEAIGIRVVIGGQEILAGVDLAVERGRVLGVLGPSGAGKTTLFAALTGETPQDDGCVRLNGRDVTRLPLWKRARLGLGYVPQTPSVLFDLTVADNIRTFEHAARVASIPVRERAEMVELGTRLEVKARSLSGGERRRLEVLRALIADPEVLIVDEPFAGGDPAHVRMIADLLRSHANRGRAVVLADHRVATALGICDDAILLADARVLVQLPAAEFAGHPAVRRRYLEAPNA